MFGFLKNIFGGSDIIKKGAELLDEAFYTDEEKAQDKERLIQLKAEQKIKLLEAYHPFKVTQRILAVAFVFTFLFIVINGILGALYGWVDMKRVKDALEFANSVNLGWIVMTIVGFYFGGGFVESFKKVKG
jgi:F0F1-type ATP synthase assembly protein I